MRYTDGYYGPGSLVDLYKATGANNQKWRYERSSGQIISMQTAWEKCTLCLDAFCRILAPLATPATHRSPGAMYRSGWKRELQTQCSG